MGIIRAVKLALDRGVNGPLIRHSSFTFASTGRRGKAMG